MAKVDFVQKQTEREREKVQAQGFVSSQSEMPAMPDRGDMESLDAVSL